MYSVSYMKNYLIVHDYDTYKKSLSMLNIWTSFRKLKFPQLYKGKCLSLGSV